MKKVVYASFALLLVSIIFFACRPSSKEAGKYYDALISQEAKVINAEKELITSLNTNMASDKIDSAYSKLLKQLKASTDSVKNAESFDNSSTLKDALVELFNTYSSVAEKEYSEFIKLTKVSDTLTTMAEDYDKKIEYTDRIDSLLNAAIDKFDEADDAFMNEYHIKFVKAENRDTTQTQAK